MIDSLSLSFSFSLSLSIYIYIYIYNSKLYIIYNDDEMFIKIFHSFLNKSVNIIMNDC